MMDASHIDYVARGFDQSVTQGHNPRLFLKASAPAFI